MRGHCFSFEKGGAPGGRVFLWGAKAGQEQLPAFPLPTHQRDPRSSACVVKAYKSCVVEAPDPSTLLPKVPLPTHTTAHDAACGDVFRLSSGAVTYRSAPLCQIPCPPNPSRFRDYGSCV